MDEAIARARRLWITYRAFSQRFSGVLSHYGLVKLVNVILKSNFNRMLILLDLTDGEMLFS